MRRPVGIALIVAVVLLAILGAALFVQYQKTTTNLAQTKASEQAAQSKYAETIDAIAEIQDSLNAINLGPEAANMRALETGQRVEGPNRQAAIQRISILRASLDRNRTRISELESSLRKSGIRVTGLNRMIANLKKDASEKALMIADLNTRVGELQTQVAGLTTTVQAREDTLRVRDQMLEDRRRELATVFYVVGTKKELAQAGVIRSRGGVLGIGKTLQPSPSPNTAVFTSIDTDQQDVIRTDVPKIRVLSAQPATSYYLQQVDGKMEIHIVKPEEFRKVKQVVILAT